MDPVKLRFYTEKFEKERKFLRLQEKFVAVPRTEYVTGKLHTKRDAIAESDVPQRYFDLVTRRMILAPTDIYAFRPPTVNMEYGWFAQPLIPRADDDRRLRFPRMDADFISAELRMRHVLRGLPAEKFTGTPFRA